MDRPHCCPICNEYRVTTTLQEVNVTATFRGDDRTVHALASFTCDRGHVFFVRMADLTIESSALLSRPPRP
jgi:hypothetical protein